MRAKIRSILPLILSTLLIFSGSIFTIGAASPAQTLNLPASGDVVISDDEQPKVTDRVARISYLKGNAKIRRSGATNWENVTLNLPLVEGDEIATDKGARLEIQFEKNAHARLDENSYLKLTTLRHDGIVLSLSLGTMNARLTRLDKDKSFFEIDAPKTTIAIQKSGSYRIDAGQDGSSEVRVRALNDGEARVYSDNSGFTLRNGRSTRIFIAGAKVGEWETGEALRLQDEFDEWSLDRDDRIARSIRDAYYDRYYDNDIYGADDLNGYGDWVYLRDYGYVWRPSRQAISVYVNWSPYRYGHWRWMPPYGWIWVNDEPWGWATYHHGRWFYHGGYWYWSPYGYYRPRRSWWYPALVVINIINTDVYWYPASYYYSYRDCRWQYYQSHHGNNQQGGGGSPTGTPTPTPGPVPTQSPVRWANIRRTEVDVAVPPTGVVTVKYDEFGTGKTRGVTPPLAIANAVIKTKGDDLPLPQLPVGTDVKVRMSPDIIANSPKSETKQSQISVGATVRTTAEPLDEELRNTKVFGGRPPKVEPGMGGTVTDTAPTKGETRDTGAVVRTPPIKNDNSAPVESPPIYSPPSDTKPTRRDLPPKREEPPTKEPPVYVPPPKRDDPPPTRYEPPKSDPPPRYDPPPPPPPKYDPPPRNDPPPKRDDPEPSKKPDGKRR